MTSPSDAHRMLDIESMSLHPTNSLILSIGIVWFYPWKRWEDCIVGNSLIIPDIGSQLILGREVSASTQEFWRKQPLEASEHWRKGQPGCDNLKDVCEIMRPMLAGEQPVWANHIMFDLANVDGFYRQVTGSGAPWHYRSPNDMPSFTKNVPPTYTGDMIDDSIYQGYHMVDHEPVSDCVRQVRAVWESWPDRRP